MKKYYLSAVCIVLLSLGTLVVNAQDKDTKEKPSKSKSGSGDEIIIRRKSGDNTKVVVEIKDGEVLVNGKPIEDFDDDNVAVIKRRVPRVAVTAPSSQFRSYGLTHDGEGDGWVTAQGNSAFLGVSTDEDDGGAKITNVTDGSAAEKAGLKEDDVITKINDTKIEDPGDLTKAIGKYKPEDKVTVTYKRDGKEQKATATLGKNKNSYSYSYTLPQGTIAPEFDFNWNNDFHGLTYAFGGRPHIGIRAQDTEDGKGVKVLEVADESAAEKSGIKKDDIITEFDGKKVNSADDLAEAAQDAREKTSVSVKLTRAGKAQTLEIKRPKKLKTTNL